MNFDVWFKNKSKKVQMILLIIPVCNWVIASLQRFSTMMKKPKPINIAGFLVMAILGLGNVPVWADAAWYWFKDQQLLMDAVTDEEQQARDQAWEEKKAKAIASLDRKNLKKYDDLSGEELFNAMLLYRKHAVIKLLACFLGWTSICISFFVAGWPLIVTGVLIMAVPSIVKSFGVMGGGTGLFSSASTSIRTYDVYDDGHKVETTTVGEGIAGHILGFIFHILLVVIVGAVMTPVELIFDSLKFFKLAGGFHYSRNWLLFTDIGALVYAIAFIIIAIAIAISHMA